MVYIQTVTSLVLLCYKPLRVPGFTAHQGSPPQYSLPKALSWVTMAAPGSGRIQSAEEIHDLIRAAVAQRRPIAALYKERNRLLCPHRLGWNKEGSPRL